MHTKEIVALHLPERFTRKLDKDVTYLLNYKDIDIEQIILFGSCARGTYKVTSDLDVLVIAKERVDRHIRGDIASELDEAIDDVRTDIVFYARQIFDTSDSLLIKQIRQDGIIIYNNRENCIGGILS